MLGIRVGFFLALRQIKRSSKWSTFLIITVMLLTFLNLVVVSGILVGLIEGASRANKDLYTSDVILSSLKEKRYINNSNEILSTIKTFPEIESVTARYVESGTIEANYKTRTRRDDLPEEVGTIISGINPEDEDSVTGLSNLLIEGEYLESTDFDKVIIGSLLLTRYFPLDSPGFLTLDDVFVGSKIRVTVNGNTREMTVKGITSSKVDEIDRRIFIVDSQLRSMIGRSDYNVDEISIKLKDTDDADMVKSVLLTNDFDKFAKVQTWLDAQPKFLQDIKDTFSLLGSIISSIGLVVAAITIFIVIFINAIKNKKYIGIMKAIGITKVSIEWSYVFQSLFYAIIGSVLGLMIVYLFLVPFIEANPIDFPFSDGILVAPAAGTTFRLILLITTTAIAGYIPSRLITGQNTLDSILGRK